MIYHFPSSVGAHLDFALILAPKKKKEMGIGIMATAMKPSNEPAQLTPRLRNIWRANSGNPAANAERRKVFAAMADAALFLAFVRLRKFCEGG